eukprot:scaffold417_cov184-Alexandrium_tamarense.AAC.11
MSAIDLTKLAQLVPLNDEHHAPVQEPLPQIRRNRMSRSCSDLSIYKKAHAGTCIGRKGNEVGMKEY